MKIMRCALEVPLEAAFRLMMLFYFPNALCPPWITPCAPLLNALSVFMKLSESEVAIDRVMTSNCRRNIFRVLAISYSHQRWRCILPFLPYPKSLVSSS
jgi:hypothetical protein